MHFRMTCFHRSTEGLPTFLWVRQGRPGSGAELTNATTAVLYATAPAKRLPVITRVKSFAE